MKVKQLVLTAALCVPVLAFASGFGGGVFGGAAGFYSGASGTASSESSGSATAGSQVLGNGYSIQGAGAISGGSATIGGDVGIDHATINTGTTNYAMTGNFGATNQQVMDGTTILNGSQAFGTTSNTAQGDAAWGAGAIGVGFGEFAGFGSFGGMPQ